ncbi:YceH family protein [Conexibacter sp. DBS9H8]|uniref:YceH family protein n=1 Tax=Conexibacter sp. DBS9H8 TaxID=2937801 RepID=UPI00200E83F7|nr:YceH family protein [Conexibacter sp. DBS9H8]
MHFSVLTPAEQRVLGCLIEKRFTTPEQYPLSLNALRLAANQATNRDPVTAYDEATVNAAAQRLSRYGLARLASGHSSRATKYRHLAEEALGIRGGELAALCVLLLRGPQTPGELKARTERMVAFTSLEAVDAALNELAGRGYAQRLERRPGQKEDRWAHRLGGTADATVNDVTSPAAAPVVPLGDGQAAPPVAAAPPAHAAAPPGPLGPLGSPADVPATAGDLAALHARVSRLEEEVAALRAALGE